MKTQTTALPALLALPLLFVAGPVVDAEAQAPTAGSQWLAWYGCWEADDVRDDESPLLVCFEPMDDEAGVEIRTLADGDVLGVEHIVADGTPVAAEEGGCTGDRSATWSADGARVFISSELHCAEGVTRSTSGVMALTNEGNQWLEIHAVRSGDREPILGVRAFAPASREAMEAQGVQPPVADRGLAVRTARSVVSAPLSPADVSEAVELAGAPVTRALIAEIGHPFQLSSDVARELTRQGVPGDVLDVMVAVTYPERFDIEGASWEAEQAPPARYAQPRATRSVAGWPDRGPRYRAGYSPWALDWYYMRGYYGFGARYWDPYWGYGAGGIFPGRVIVVQPEVRDRRARVNPVTGYTTDRSSDRSATRSGTTGAPSSQPSTNRSPRPARSADPPSTRTRPTTTRVTPQGARSGGSNSGDRRARQGNRSGSSSGGGGGG